MAMMVEIKSAYNKLSTEDRGVLYYKYSESLDYASIAKQMEIGSEDAARMRHNRAIKKLINRIGGYKPFSDRDSKEPPTEEQEEAIDYEQADEE
jgi:DNA-directed RNA polymerase specialized sigma24 family protein